MRNGFEEYHQEIREGRRRTAVIYSFSIFLLLLLGFFSVCLRTDGSGMLSPVHAAENILAVLKHLLYGISGRSGNFAAEVFTANDKDYYTVLNNLNSVFVTLTAGAILSLSGAVYQNVFRNPLAAPTMLGITNGINIGLLLLVLHYSTAAIMLQRERYLYTYGCALGMLVLILAAGKIAGRHGLSVDDMLLVGIVISQITGVVLVYYEFHLPLEDLELLQNFVLGRLTSITGLSMKIFLGAVMLGLLPVFLLRYSINAVSFREEETVSMGINGGVLRVISLLAATMLVTASMIHCGSIGVISMIVPYIGRYLFGSDFRSLFSACIILGAVILLICRDITCALSAVFGYIPVGIFVSFIGTPIFLYMLIKQRRGWE